MGEKLVRIFEIVTERAGYKGRLELANKSGMTMTQAAGMQDTDELVKKLKATASEIIDKGLQ